MRERNGEVNERVRCVLVVEDEIFIALELSDALTDGGFRVLGPASSVTEALDLLAGERPDAAVLDVNLGKEKVTPVALFLKSLGVPFIVASASNRAELAHIAVLSEVPNLGKPTDLTRLVDAVRALEG
ncbi:response regulator [Neorhizobium sp. T786]|uniref:response regulator n=1 Tax=Pseudorhizobium xiangyangii TaxID=2883104 RepID=UPI001CFFB6AE|nr:response regulator [Neorhizobium xiangyangii]MCB5205251.1 response regulator [Neorhizobium xiangyangii]